MTPPFSSGSHLSDFHLNVQQVDTVCLFELSWGKGQRLNTRIPYPPLLEQRYQEWRQLYLTFYSQLSIMDSSTDSSIGESDTLPNATPNSPTPPSSMPPSRRPSGHPANSPPDSLRGKVVGGGHVALPPMDWHEMLVQAETALTYEFQRWLRHGDLFDIRAAIANATAIQSISGPAFDPIVNASDGRADSFDRQGGRSASSNRQGSLGRNFPGNHSPGKGHIRLFLSCLPLSLARFPWEAWELGTEFSSTCPIQIVRSTLTIQASSESTPKNHRRRPRILVILGDNTGLNFKGDREAVQALDKRADIQFKGWQPGQSPTTVRQTICDAIADEDGWDALLFAGHSDEQDLMGGQLAIAPKVFMSIKEMRPYLAIAKRNGLQFALFNSCSGLDIAESLIDIGLSQVIVMREPIHNRVAQSFIRRFMQCLAQGADVQAAMTVACRTLKLDQQFTYPSAHLVPSLFCHPHAHLFRIPTRGLRQRLKTLIPLRYEAIALTACLGLSLLPMAQSFGVNQRLWTQSVYRQLTNQVPSTESPPVVLVQIDRDSINRERRLHVPIPIDRSYLADLIQQLTSHNASVIGIDYLLDGQAGEVANDKALRDAIDQAVDKNVWLVFGSIFSEQNKTVGLNRESQLAEPGWVMESHILMELGYMTLKVARDDAPFAYLLSLLHHAIQHDNIEAQLQRPSRANEDNLRDQFIAQMNALADQSKTLSQKKLSEIQARSYFAPITLWSYDKFPSWLRQKWFAQLIDFSIPPDAIYARVPAWAVLHPAITEQIPDLSGKTVMIVPGGYSQAGIDETSDNAPLPTATRYWYSKFPPTSPLVNDPETGSPIFSGTRGKLPKGEAHAYMVHHFLNQRTVTHVPDSWVVAIAALCGYFIAQYLLKVYPRNQWTQTQRRNLTLSFAGLTGLSGVASLQLYISAGILLSWTLPIVLFWMYLLRVLRRKPHAE